VIGIKFDFNAWRATKTPDRQLARARPGPRHEPPALPWPVRGTARPGVFLSARVDRLAPGVATLLFISYAALTGVTLSALVLAYTGASIATTFVVTAGMFGALALYGSTTRRSLAGMGQFFFMGLIGLVSRPSWGSSGTARPCSS
jgi:hypothetical protein